MKRSLALIFLLTLSACGGFAAQESAVAAAPLADYPAPTNSAEPAPVDAVRAGTNETTTVSELASRTRPLGSAILQPPGEAIPMPVGLRIDSLDIADAAVVDVGVERNGEMEIPGATEIGWYRFGSSPGEPGSAVLAAHIAFNGRDGVFRNLDEIAVGDIVEVLYDDGSSQRFEITETAQYAKDELPINRVFAKDGSPELTLITCGGDFNRSLNGYTDNVVAYAAPVAP
jgi:LPXTG-site transpeptidase (sortase) family protein